MKTIKQHIKSLTKAQFIELKNYCYHSNSLYNSTLYLINTYFKETNKYLGYNETYHLIKTNIHYTSLPAPSAQEILKLVDKNFKSFFKLLDLKNKGTYNKQVNPPHYRKPGDMFNLIFNNQRARLKNNTLTLTKTLKFKFNYEINGIIKQALIKPNSNYYYTLYLTYEETKTPNPNLDKNNYISIDLGINNLTSCFSNVGPSFIMNGKPLKSYNQNYNKKKAKIQSELKTKNNKNWSNNLSKLTINRENFIDNYLNQTVSGIIKQSLEYNVGNIILGYNQEWKQDINIGTVNNQKFTNIPYFKLKNKLEFKCKENFINFITTEESYTSKCSFLDTEEVKKHETYVGKRVKRGLFKTSTNKLINADINGAANILKKVISNVEITNEIEAFIVKPIMFKNIFQGV
jgi:IS605 OrfB family transposase